MIVRITLPAAQAAVSFYCTEVVIERAMVVSLGQGH